MKTWGKASAFVASLVAGIGMTQATVATSAADTVYRLTDLGTLPGGNSSIAWDINNLGQIAGFSNTGSSTRAFLWDEATGMQDLGDLPGGHDVSRAFSVNDLGQVTGESRGPNSYRAFIWDISNGMQEIGPDVPGIVTGFGHGINNFGVVVGRYLLETTPGTYSNYAFIWDKDLGARDLRILDGGSFSYAYDVNDAGQIAGESGTATGVRAVLWDPLGGVQDLGIIGKEYSVAHALNSSGHVVGVADDYRGFGRAFLWTPADGMQLLGFLPGHIKSFADDINDVGKVVGTSCSWSDCRRFIWDAENGMRDLKSLIADYDPLKTYVQLDVRVSINNAGSIAVNGIDSRTGETHAYLLRPRGTPTELLDDLLEDVTGVGPGTSLADKITIAQTYYVVPDITSTCSMLDDFKNQVSAQSGKKLDEAFADELINDATEIMLAIECQ